jgi:hypothetical protein
MARTGVEGNAVKNATVAGRLRKIKCFMIKPSNRRRKWVSDDTI